MALLKLLLPFIKELLFGKVNLWQYFKTHKLIALIFVCLILSVAMSVAISRQGFHYSALAAKYKHDNILLTQALQKCNANKPKPHYIYKTVTVETMKDCKVPPKPLKKSLATAPPLSKPAKEHSKVNDLLKRELGDIR